MKNKKLEEVALEVIKDALKLMPVEELATLINCTLTPEKLVRLRNRLTLRGRDRSAPPPAKRVSL